MEEAVRVLPVSAVGRPSDGVDVGDVARLRPHGAEKCSGRHRRRPFFHVVRLADDATLLGPVGVQREDNLLEIQGFHALNYIMGRGVRV